MMNNIYLTFDIETIVSPRSASDDYVITCFLGALYIAEELSKRNLKATFYISLSPKNLAIDYLCYSEMIGNLISILKNYNNIRLAPHLHVKNIPASFDCFSDSFADYNYDQQVELLSYAKEFFENQGVFVSSFRPGGFLINETYYKSLFDSGYKYSSILPRSIPPVYNYNSHCFTPNYPFLSEYNIYEFPVTSVLVRSIKQKDELLNLSPDFFSIDSQKILLNKLEYSCINFHSFSIYKNRLVRENHMGQMKNNLFYLFLERNMEKLLNIFSLTILNQNTITRKELIKWLDYVKIRKFETKFIGDI